MWSVWEKTAFSLPICSCLTLQKKKVFSTLKLRTWTERQIWRWKVSPKILSSHFRQAMPNIVNWLVESISRLQITGSTSLMVTSIWLTLSIVTFRTSLHSLLSILLTLVGNHASSLLVIIMWRSGACRWGTLSMSRESQFTLATILKYRWTQQVLLIRHQTSAKSWTSKSLSSFWYRSWLLCSVQL